jgi:hypothetical protein
LKLSQTTNFILPRDDISTHIEYRQMHNITHACSLPDFGHSVLAFELKHGNLFGWRRLRWWRGAGLSRIIFHNGIILELPPRVA